MESSKQRRMLGSKPVGAWESALLSLPRDGGSLLGLSVGNARMHSSWFTQAWVGSQSLLPSTSEHNYEHWAHQGNFQEYRCPGSTDWTLS